MPYYFDMIISLGYRVKSKIATNFRRWATKRLKEYMIKGFAMDDEWLMIEIIVLLFHKSPDSTINVKIEFGVEAYREMWEDENE